MQDSPLNIYHAEKRSHASRKNFESSAYKEGLKKYMKNSELSSQSRLTSMILKDIHESENTPSYKQLMKKSSQMERRISDKMDTLNASIQNSTSELNHWKSGKASSRIDEKPNIEEMEDKAVGTSQKYVPNETEYKSFENNYLQTRVIPAKASNTYVNQNHLNGALPPNFANIRPASAPKMIKHPEGHSNIIFHQPNPAQILHQQPIIRNPNTIVSRVINSNEGMPINYALLGMPPSNVGQGRQILIQSPQYGENIPYNQNPQLIKSQSQSGLRKAPSVFEYQNNIQMNSTSSTNWSQQSHNIERQRTVINSEDYQRHLQEQYLKFNSQNNSTTGVRVIERSNSNVVLNQNIEKVSSNPLNIINEGSERSSVQKGTSTLVPTAADDLDDEKKKLERKRREMYTEKIEEQFKNLDNIQQDFQSLKDDDEITDLTNLKKENFDDCREYLRQMDEILNKYGKKAPPAPEPGRLQPKSNNEEKLNELNESINDESPLLNVANAESRVESVPIFSKRKWEREEEEGDFLERTKNQVFNWMENLIK